MLIFDGSDSAKSAENLPLQQLFTGYVPVLAPYRPPHRLDIHVETKMSSYSD
jgi:hypothetical protein